MFCLEKLIKLKRMGERICPKCKKGKLKLVNDFYDDVYLSCSNCDYIKK
jgi:predicted  nucleic acid-binding Zn ribbon protein